MQALCDERDEMMESAKRGAFDVFVCPEGHVNGSSWRDVGCEECYASTVPVRVVPVAEVVAFLRGAKGWAEDDVYADAVEQRFAACGDPTCSCQDGDACHYRDAHGTRGWKR